MARRAPEPALPDALGEGDMEIEGRMPWSSNATFLVNLRLGEQCVRAIYKPHRGERPLWDFPSGLYQREVAAYELAQFLGWDMVPRTLRRDGVHGVGSVQEFVDAQFEQHYFSMLEGGHLGLAQQLKRIAVFDILANNADRKGGHCLLDGDHHVWGIDHGLCFHTEPKLRTVMWDFAGERIPKALLGPVARVADADPASGELGPLCDLLDEDELVALVQRARRVIAKPVYPPPRSNYAYPWPLV